MKKLRLLLLGLLIAGIVYWLAGKVGGPPDPEYQGRRLSAMLKESSLDVHTLESGRETRFGAEDVLAIRQMGTNAIPYLLKELSATDSSLKIKLVELLSRQSVFSIRFEMAAYHHYRAADAFQVLGPIGEPAIPELARLLNEGETSDHAAMALAGIGDKSIPILIQTLSHTNASVRASAAGALGTFSSGASVIVPALIQSLGDPNKDVRFTAAYSLGKRHQEAALAVPALMKCLEDAAPIMRAFSANALEKFGAEAKPAIPALLKARETTNTYTRDTIDRALRAIDPEAAARAGIQ